MWPQNENPLTRVEEYQSRALSTDSHSEDLLHSPSLVSQPPPLLRGVPLHVPGPVLVVSLLVEPKNHRGLLKFHPPHRQIIINVITAGGLKICLFAQINPNILEHSGEEATIGEYAGRAFAT